MTKAKLMLPALVLIAACGDVAGTSNATLNTATVRRDGGPSGSFYPSADSLNGGTAGGSGGASNSTVGNGTLGSGYDVTTPDGNGTLGSGH
jgi:hypothetical protein